MSSGSHQEHSRSNVIAVTCLFASIICWGVPPVMLRYLTRAIPDGYTTNLVRYPVSTILYLPLILWAVRRRSLGRFWWTALVPAIINIIGQTLFAWTPYFMSASMMGFLVRVSIVWSILGAFLLFPDERPLARSRLFWTGALLAVSGFVLMSLMALRGGSITRAGALVVLLCSIFWGLYDITVRYTMRDLHPLVVFGVIGNYSSVGLILLAPLGQPNSVLHLSACNAALLIVSALIGIAAAHGMYYIAIQRLGVSVCAITLMLTPFVSMLAAHRFLHERLAPMQAAGGFVLIGGATLALWSRQRVSRRLAAPIDLGPD